MKWHVAYKLENFFHLFPSISFRIRFHRKFHVNMIRIGVMAETLYFAFPIPCVIRSELNFVLHTENRIQRYWMTGGIQSFSFAFCKVLKNNFLMWWRPVNGLLFRLDISIPCHSQNYKRITPSSRQWHRHLSVEKIFISTCKSIRQWKSWIMNVGELWLHRIIWAHEYNNIIICKNYIWMGKLFALGKAL